MWADLIGTGNIRHAAQTHYNGKTTAHTFETSQKKPSCDGFALVSRSTMRDGDLEQFLPRESSIDDEFFTWIAQRGLLHAHSTLLLFAIVSDKI